MSRSQHTPVCPLRKRRQGSGGCKNQQGQDTKSLATNRLPPARGARARGNTKRRRRNTEREPAVLWHAATAQQLSGSGHKQLVSRTPKTA